MNETHFDQYSKLNDKLLRLILSGKGESREANDVRNEMDVHWFAMTDMEQDLMRKHNERRV